MPRTRAGRRQPTDARMAVPAVPRPLRRGHRRGHLREAAGRRPSTYRSRRRTSRSSTLDRSSLSSSTIRPPPPTSKSRRNAPRCSATSRSDTQPWPIPCQTTPSTASSSPLCSTSGRGALTVSRRAKPSACQQAHLTTSALASESNVSPPPRHSAHPARNPPQPPGWAPRRPEGGRHSARSRTRPRGVEAVGQSRRTKKCSSACVGPQEPLPWSGRGRGRRHPWRARPAREVRPWPPGGRGRVGSAGAGCLGCLTPVLVAVFPADGSVGFSDGDGLPRAGGQGAVGQRRTVVAGRVGPCGAGGEDPRATGADPARGDRAPVPGQEPVHAAAQQPTVHVAQRLATPGKDSRARSRTGRRGCFMCSSSSVSRTPAAGRERNGPTVTGPHPRKVRAGPHRARARRTGKTAGPARAAMSSAPPPSAPELEHHTRLYHSKYEDKVTAVPAASPAAPTQRPPRREPRILHPLIAQEHRSTQPHKRGLARQQTEPDRPPSQNGPGAHPWPPITRLR